MQLKVNNGVKVHSLDIEEHVMKGKSEKQVGYLKDKSKGIILMK
ncbi:hypothetical protein [Clostridium neonatale]|nr:hypothetical protein [Clostridium neonatale]SUQ54852.1 hypothetical protein CNEONATNEC86_03747 [Clostridium neonatale]